MKRSQKHLLIAAILSAAHPAYADRSNELSENQEVCVTPPSSQPELMCMERGLSIDPKSLPAAYNQCASIRKPCGMDIFSSASFLYWIANQDSMAIAISRSVNSATFASVPSANSETLVYQPEYAPGFKIGLGANMARDGWVVFGEYTRLYGRSRTVANAPLATAGSGHTGVWSNYWFDGSTTVSSTRSSLQWKYGLDLADLNLSRPYYLGTKLILEPFAGVRGAWINQRVKAAMEGIVYNGLGIFSQGSSHHRSNSWGVGPRIGMNGNWHVKYGVRLNGNANASLLFTRYTRVSVVQDNVGFPANPAATAFNNKMSGYDTVRAAAGGAVGLGWGRYLSCQNYYLDFAANYEFNIFWNQNLFLTQIQSAPGNTSHRFAADLLIHGLTLSGRFDF